MSKVEHPVYLISHLSFRYPNSARYILKNATLSIPQNAITAILGINGSGKSTFLQILLGSLLPESGEIKLSLIDKAGKNLNDHRGRIAFVPQSEYLGFDYSVMEYILFGRVPYVELFSSPNENDQRYIQQVIKNLELTTLIDQKITHLSGGELQKVRIARALAQDPAVMLLDEPTTYLDLYSKKTILDILDHLKEKSVSVIFATHDPTEASSIANYFIMMRKESKLICGYKKEVFSNNILSDTYAMNLRIVSLEGKEFIITD